MKAMKNKFNPFKAPITFRVWNDGKAHKLTLKNGETVERHTFRETDEGYSSNLVSFKNDNGLLVQETACLCRKRPACAGNGLLVQETAYAGRDCDG